MEWVPSTYSTSQHVSVDPYARRDERVWSAFRRFEKQEGAHMKPFMTSALHFQQLETGRTDHLAYWIGKYRSTGAHLFQAKLKFPKGVRYLVAGSYQQPRIEQIVDQCCRYGNFSARPYQLGQPSNGSTDPCVWALYRQCCAEKGFDAIGLILKRTQAGNSGRTGIGRKSTIRPPGKVMTRRQPGIRRLSKHCAYPFGLSIDRGWGQPSWIGSRANGASSVSSTFILFHFSLRSLLP